MIGSGVGARVRDPPVWTPAYRIGAGHGRAHHGGRRTACLRHARPPHGPQPRPARGSAGRHEPAHTDAIIEAEIERALDDPDPLRGLAQLTARWAAALVLDPAGVTRTKALGTERMARTLRDALAGGEEALRSAVWGFLRPMLSPAWPR
jgi:hypothetical protein